MKKHQDEIAALTVRNGVIVDARPRAVKKWLVRLWFTMLVIGAALGAMALAEPPQAKADEDSYAYALARAGYNGPIVSWVARGHTICRLQAEGTPLSAIAIGIVATTGSGIYTEDAYEIIGIANDHLCNQARMRV